MREEVAIVVVVDVIAFLRSQLENENQLFQVTRYTAAADTV